MAKKRIYFVQTGCVCDNEHYLPYAVGMLAASAFANDEIKNAYEIAGFIYKSDGAESTAAEINEPDILVCSNYMWNFRFNLKLAEIIKKNHPNCTVIFGGHQIADGKEWLEKHSFIDYTITGEGEPILTALLLSLIGKADRHAVNNICFRENGKTIATEKASITCDINTYPSPYLTGLFDSLADSGGDKFSAIIETNRGCPHHCAYCDWGDYAVKMRKFSKERVCAEIEWLGKHKIPFFVIADSNFGIYSDDEIYIDKIIETKNKFGCPAGLSLAFTKNSTEKIFEMNKKLYENGLSRGATLSLQTLSPAALENIGRRNMPKELFLELMKLYNSNSIPAYTELILGLPGETYDSFCEGIEFLLENGQHNSIRVFLCEILPNAVMGGADYIKKHGIKYVRRAFVMRAGNAGVAGADGDSCIVTATSSMSREEMLDALMFSLVIQVFHNYGLLRFFAMYLFDKKGIKYSRFYNELMQWAEQNPQTKLGKTYAGFKEIYRKSLLGECSDTYFNEKFGNIELNLTDGAFLELVTDFDCFYAEADLFLDRYLADDKMRQSLTCFQRVMINRPCSARRTAEYEYDWADYFKSIMSMSEHPLKKNGVCTIAVELAAEHASMPAYVANVVLKGRRTGASLAINSFHLL